MCQSGGQARVSVSVCVANHDSATIANTTAGVEVEGDVDDASATSLSVRDSRALPPLVQPEDAECGIAVVGVASDKDEPASVSDRRALPPSVQPDNADDAECGVAVVGAEPFAMDGPADTKQHPARRVHRRLDPRGWAFAAAALAIFSDYFGLAMLYPSVPFYIEELGVTDEDEAALWNGAILEGATHSYIAP